MSYLPKFILPLNVPKTVAEQVCVKAVLKSNLPQKIKEEAANFISRNVIEDCGKVAPNCLKAHLIKTAKKMKMNDKINYIDSLFKAKIGYQGYYLDSGKLMKV